MQAIGGLKIWRITWRTITSLGIESLPLESLSSCLQLWWQPIFPLLVPKFVRHQLRWARTVRDSRKSGLCRVRAYFRFALGFGRFGSLGGARWSWLLLALTACMRLLVAYVVGSKVLGDSQLARSLGLIPFRDLIAVGVWLVSFTGHTIEWRGDQFLLKNGKLDRLSS